MQQLVERLQATLADAGGNDRIEVTALSFSPPYDEATFTELAHDLEVTYAPDLRAFYTQVGSISFSWKARLADVPAEDASYLGGAIEILNPFDIVMGKGGQRWKGELWFDEMPEGERNAIQAFAPLDIPTTECMAGFQRNSSGMESEMKLLSSNDGIIPFGLTLPDYLECLIDTRGFYYWQIFLRQPGSPEYRRFMRNMPGLFPGFNSTFFNRFS